MNTWHSLELGKGIEAFDLGNKIQDAYMPLCAAAGCPKDMAVFDLCDKDTNVTTFFFTPSAHVLAKVFNAKPCEKPSSPDLGLYVGDASCWDIFFPNIALERKQ